MSDHYGEAEKLLGSVHFPNLEQVPRLAVAHALLALVDGVDELIESLSGEEDEEEDEE